MSCPVSLVRSDWYLGWSGEVSEERTSSQAVQVIESHPAVESLARPWLAQAGVGVGGPEGLQLVPVVRGEVGRQANTLISRAKLVKLVIQILDTGQDTEVDIEDQQSGHSRELLVIEWSQVEQVVGIFLVMLTGHNVHVSVSLHRLDQVSLIPHKILDVHIGKLYSG